METWDSAAAVALKDVRAARATLYGAAVPYREKAARAAALAVTLGLGSGGARYGSGSARGGDRSGAPAVAVGQGAALLVEWSLAVLAYGGLATRTAAVATSAGGGKGAKGGAAGGGGGGPPARPPRAVGVEAPAPAALCADAVPWAALNAGLNLNAGGGGGAYQPGAAAAAHIMHAAAAAATAAAPPPGKNKGAGVDGVAVTTVAAVTPASVAEALAQLRGRLRGQFRPAPDQCLATVVAAMNQQLQQRRQPRGAHTPLCALLVEEALCLLTRTIRLAPHRSPPSLDPATLDMLLAAAAEEAADAAALAAAGSRSGSDWEGRGQRGGAGAGGGVSEGAALGALRALLLHPMHLAGVPHAFAAAEAAAAESPEPRPAAKRSRKAKQEDAKEADNDDSEEAAVAAPTSPVTQVPAFVSRAAARICVEARAGAGYGIAREGYGEVGCDPLVLWLAPWVLTAFIAEASAAAAAAAAASRGGRAGGASAATPSTVAAPAAVAGPARLLFDALFAPLIASEAGHGDSSGGCEETKVSTRGRKASHGGSLKETATATAKAQTRAREEAEISGRGNARRLVAAAIIRAVDGAGLYSPAAAGGGPAPAPGRPPVRDRLEAYAAAVLATSSPGVDGDRLGAAAAADALLGLDLRLVEPHAMPLVAAMWGAPIGCVNGAGTYSDHAAGVAVIVRMIGGYAATRQLPEFLSAVGAAAAALADAAGGAARGVSVAATAATSSEGVIDAAAVLHAVALAAGGIPQGQVRAAIEAAHGAVSLALGSGIPVGADSPRAGGIHGERVAALAALVASVLSSLPASPGDPLPSAAAAALKELTQEIEGRLGDWHRSISGGREGSIGSSNRSKTPKKGGKEGDCVNPGTGSDMGAGAAIAGALLSVYTPAAALLEVGHSRAALYGAANEPYLGSGGPPLAEVVVALLGGGGGGDGDGGPPRTGTATGAAAAGAALHRVLQLARTARQPPAGDGDEIAASEARQLVACLLACVRAGDGDIEAKTGTGATAVRALLAQCMDVWVEWATAEELKGWVKAGGEEIFGDPHLLTLWTREVAQEVLDASRAVVRALGSRGGGDSLGAAALGVVDAASEGLGVVRTDADDGIGDVTATAWDPGAMQEHGGAFWGQAVRALGDKGGISGGSGWVSNKEAGKIPGKRSRNVGGVDCGDGDEMFVMLAALKDAIADLQTMPRQCAAHVDVTRLAAAAAAADCVAFAVAAALDDTDGRQLALSLDTIAAARDAAATLANVDRGAAKLALAVCVSAGGEKGRDYGAAPAAQATSALTRAVSNSSASTSVEAATIRDALHRVAFATARLVHATLVTAGPNALRAAAATAAIMTADLAAEAAAVNSDGVWGLSLAKAKGAMKPATTITTTTTLMPRALRLKAQAAAAAAAIAALSSAATPSTRNNDAYATTTAATTVIRADVGGTGVFAAALAEAVLVAALNGVPAVEEEARMSGTADEAAGAEVVVAWEATTSLRAAIDAAAAALMGTAAVCGGRSSADGGGVVEALAGILAASAAATSLAELGMRHAPISAQIAPDAEALKRSLSIALLALSGDGGGIHGGDGHARADGAYTAVEDGSSRPGVHHGQAVTRCWVTAHPRAAAKAAGVVEAAVGVLSAAGPALSPPAHAALLAAVVSAYDVAARWEVVSKESKGGGGQERVGADMKPAYGGGALPLSAPPPALKRALNGALAALLRGAGKRLIGAAYRSAIDRLRAADATARRLTPGLTGGRGTESSGWRVAASLAAPMWCLQTLIDYGGSGGKAARLAAESNAEEAVTVLVGALRLAAEGGAGPVGGDAARAITSSALAAMNTLASRGDRCPLSSRCVARMAQASMLCLPTAAASSSVKSVFAPACALLAIMLRCRRIELKRSAALITSSCASLLDTMRAWNHHHLRLHQSQAMTQSTIDAAGGGGGVAAAAAASAIAITTDRHNAEMRSAATALVPVYEEANSAGLGRYCAHLLADAVTACAGSGGGSGSGAGPGVGIAAEKALRPGVFALLDACGDRELQQLHGALGSVAGGARRVVLSALIDEHRRSHRYDGKV